MYGVSGRKLPHPLPPSILSRADVQLLNRPEEVIDYVIKKMTNKKIPVQYYKHPAGSVYIDDRMLNLFLPLMKKQKFIHKVVIYNNQEIDINLAVIQIN